MTFEYQRETETKVFVDAVIMAEMQPPRGSYNPVVMIISGDIYNNDE